LHNLLKRDFKNFTYNDLENFLNSIGEKPYRAHQLFDWVYRKNIKCFSKMTNISKELRTKFNELLLIYEQPDYEEFSSGDGTKKYRIKLENRNIIESVYIPETRRATLCVSTQSGCNLGCRFCLTGRGGFNRNLTVSEMVAQVLLTKDSIADKKPLTNIVLMGMGEPLLNYENVVKFINILIDSKGLAFAKRKVTLSTSGILPELDNFIKNVDVSLSISLNAPDDATRSLIMPVNKRFKLKDILGVARQYPKVRKRMVTFEYVLISGINDSPDHAHELAKLLKGIRCKINLIPYNENPFCEFRKPSDNVVAEFHDLLMKYNYTATIRKSRGQEISASCGQLGVF